ncbi:MAG: PAS domain S-box protein [Polyangiaceae bacterium]|nr:PAS domain S-box protein [Polyangiaceae bacterium]
MSQSDRSLGAIEQQADVFRHLPLLVLCCDGGGAVIDANPAALTRLGLSQDLLSSLCVDALIPELRPERWRSTKESLRSGSPVRFEATVLPWQGDGFRVELELTLLSLDNEALYVLVAREPSPSRMTPLLEQFSCEAWDHVEDAVYFIREDGSLIYVNPAACEMLGYSRAELLSMRMYEINPEVSPQRWATIWAALTQQRRRRFVSYHTTRGGRTIPVEVSASIVEVGGETFSCAFARDIAARRTAEDAHRREHALTASLIDTAPILIAVLDSAGRVIRANRFAETISGYSLDELLGQSWVDTVVHAGDRSRSEHLFRQAMSGVPIHGAGCRIQTKTGNVREIHCHEQLLSVTDTSDVGLLLIGQDVTEQRELEQSLRQSEKLQAIGRLAGGIAHDFNNQLTGIMGWAEVLTWETEGLPTLRECADRIMLAAERARGLTSQLLAYSRKGPHIARDVDLHGLVHETVSMLQRSIDKRVHLNLDLGATDAVVQGDPTQLANAILNVALNARDAMPEGGVLTFCTRLVPGKDVPGFQDLDPPLPAEFVELAVMDTGLGMDEAAMSHLFEPFFTTKQEGQGTGLGMAATYGAIRSHRGAISVESAPGRGTRILIYLPHLDGGTERAVATPAVEPQTPVSLRVMVIDDEEAVREVSARFLKRLECDVTCFANGFDAIEHFSRARREVDVVLLDLVMPWLDGKSVFFALRRIDPAVPIILVSGFSRDETAQSLIDEGASDFIAKPFTLLTLSEALSRIRPSRSIAPDGQAIGDEA